MGHLQVDGSTPYIWSIISSVVLSSLRAQVFCILFVNSFTTDISQLVEFIYVDNFDMVQSDEFKSHSLANKTHNI